MLITIIALAFVAGMAFAPKGEVVAEQPSDPVFVTEIERLFADVYKTVSPSVVSINVDQQSRDGDYFPWSGGSGFVVDRNGHIATNFHVVDGGDRISVNFYDGTITLAEVIGIDRDADLAVIEVDVPSERLVPVTFGDSENLAIGQTTLAIGSPFGQNWTLTSGIISALERQIEGFTQFDVGSVIQTDTAINPGNSGGPLLNIRAEVIGVNTQIISEERANSGIGFAIPSNLVKRVAHELIDSGEVRYSYLGMSGRDIELNDILSFDIPNNLRGVFVTRVNAGEPAFDGGLQANIDIITAINGKPVIGMSSLIGYLATNTLPGDIITLTVLREGEQRELEITLGSRR
jgi:2-alkenal reductase